LTLTTRAYLPLLDEALARVTPSHGAAQVYRPDLMGRLLAWFLEPPYRIRSATAAAFVPGTTEDAGAVMEQFQASQAELEQRLERAEGRDLGSVRLISPFNARVKYNLVSTFLIILAHERRHLWQAEQAVQTVSSVTRDEGAPN